MSASREKKLRRELREAEQNTDTVKKVKKQKKPMTAAKSRRIRSIVGTVVVVLLVVAFALLIFVNSGVLQRSATAATVGSHKLSPVEYTYFYQDSYNSMRSAYQSYGYWDYMVDTSKPIEDQDYDGEQTWGEFIRSSALSSAQQVYTLYDAAQAEGFTLSEDRQAEIDAIPGQIEANATANGYHDAEEFLTEYYGKGASMESYLRYVEAQEIASAYATEKQDSFTYTDDELKSYYNEHKTDFDTVTYRLFTVSAGDDAKTTADNMQAELDGTEDSFIKAAASYASEDAAESYADETYTLRSNASYSAVSTDYADWLFGDGRVAGESQVFATSDGGYAVVMFVSRDDHQYRTVNVRHILIQVDEEEAEDTGTLETGADLQDAENAEEADAAEETEEPAEDAGETADEVEVPDSDAWREAKARMDDIVAEWEAGDMTEDAFAALAETYSEDPGSAENGGLYEDVTKGQMVTAFNDWIFDESREPGDYGVVKTEYGYHLIYFVGYGEEQWKDSVDSAKRSADYTAWYDEQSAAYEGKTSGFGMLFVNKELSA